MSSHQNSSYEEKLPDPVPQLEDTEDDLPPPPPPADDFPPPPPLDEEFPPPEGLESPTGSRTSYAALVTPSGFVSPIRDETDANRRNFANRWVHR